MLTATLTTAAWVAVGWLPGFLVLFALRGGAGWLRNATFAPVVAIGLNMIVAQALYGLGVRIDPWTVLPISLGLPLLLAVVVRIRRPVTTDVPTPKLGTLLRSVDARLLVSAVAIGIALWTVVLPSIMSVMPNDDGTHHGLYAYRIEHYGTLDPRVVLSGDVTTGSPYSPYYPLALHVTTALVASVAHAQISVALNVGIVLGAAVILPLGMFVLTRALCPQLPLAAGLAAIIAASFPWFPFLPITWGGVTTIAGMSVVPISIDALWARKSDGPLLGMGLVLGIGAYGVFEMHNPELVSIGLFGLIVHLPRLLRLSPPLRREVLTAWAVAGATFVALIIPQLGVLTAGEGDAATFRGNEPGSGAAGHLSAIETIFTIANPILLPLALGGIVVALRRRWCLAWLVGLIVTVLLCLATTVPQISAITIPWYANWGRISYLLAFFTTTFAALGAAALIQSVQTYRARSSSHGLRMAGVLTLSLVGLLTATAVVLESIAFGQLGYGRGSLIGADERAGFAWLAAHTTSGERVLNQFSDDSAWMQMIDGVNPVFATKPDTKPADPQQKWGDRWYLLTHAAGLATDSRAQAAARTWHVAYVYVGSRVFDSHKVMLSADALAQSPAYRLVWHRGDASIFEIVAANRHE